VGLSVKLPSSKSSNIWDWQKLLHKIISKMEKYFTKRIAMVLFAENKKRL
jgi:hypothetical protein